MSKYDLSILIPARNEMFVSNTVEDILKKKTGKTEIIVGLDGEWADPGIADHPDVKILYVSEPLGQRGMTNRLCQMSKAKYVAKCDAHCSFDEGFDTKLMDAMKGHDDWTIVPTMKNLHAFDWKCMKCGKLTYQGPTPTSCADCDNVDDFKRKIYFYAKPSPNSNSYCFDKTMHFQYFKEFNKRPEGRGTLTPSLSLQGSFFMMTRDKYWELNICDEAHGSWGQQGVEVALKTWLSGGKVMVHQGTWYGHMFRTQGGDFGFPYPISGKQVDKARKYSRNLWLGSNWPQATRTLGSLLKQFAPVPDWTDADIEALDTPKQTSRGIIYFTDNQLKLKIARRVQDQIKSIGLPIVSSSLKPMDNMGKNIHVPLQRGRLAMFMQILLALEASDAEIIYFCEHDVLYSKEHFDFIPLERNKFYYNQNFWRIRKDGLAVHWDANQVSGLVGFRKHLIEYYQDLIKQIEAKGAPRSYEPGGRDKSKYETYMSSVPNIDIRHESNLTGNKWSPKDFRDKSTCVNWQESTVDKIEGWSNLSDILE